MLLSYFVTDSSILNTTGMQGEPTHPGKMLLEDFLPVCGLTVSVLCEYLGASRQSVNAVKDESLRSI